MGSFAPYTEEGEGMSWNTSLTLCTLPGCYGVDAAAIINTAVFLRIGLQKEETLLFLAVIGFLALILALSL